MEFILFSFKFHRCMKIKDFTLPVTRWCLFLIKCYTKVKLIAIKHDIKGAYWISSNSSFIQYCDSNIGLFSIAPPLVIALPTIAVAIVGRAITVWEAIQKEAMNQSTKLI